MPLSALNKVIIFVRAVLQDAFLYILYYGQLKKAPIAVIDMKR